MEWILNNWELIVIGIAVVDKIVAATPTKYDDLILTSIKAGLGKIRKTKMDAGV